MRPPSDQPPPTTDNAADFRLVFIKRVHRLLQIGYTRMNAIDFQEAEEEDISGEIRRHISEFLDEPPTESWIRFFQVHNEDPQDEGHGPRPRGRRRLGKRRRLVDIRFVCAECSPRPRFCFEAKRLNKTGAERTYFGADGLGRFIEGAYGRDDLDAGMLGYVQTGDPAEWAVKLAKGLPALSSSLVLSSGEPWKIVHMPDCPAFLYQSRHNRPKIGRCLNVYHTLLRFC
jgi:hypothetical protein